MLDRRRVLKTLAGLFLAVLRHRRLRLSPGSRAHQHVTRYRSHAARLAGGPAPAAGGHLRSPCRWSACAAVARHARSSPRPTALKPDLVLLLGDFVASRTPRASDPPMRDWAQRTRAASRPETASTPSSAIMTGGRTCRRRRTAPGRRRSGLALEAVGHHGAGEPGAAARDRRRPALARGTGRPDRLPESACAACPTASTILPGTLAQIADDGAPVIMMAHEPDVFARMPARVALDPVGPHPWRPGQALRLVAGRAVALWQPLRLWPCPRGRARPHRLGRHRHEQVADPARHPAGDRAASNWG